MTPKPLHLRVVDREFVNEPADLHDGAQQGMAGRPVSGVLDAEPDVVLAEMQAVNFVLASIFGQFRKQR